MSELFEELLEHLISEKMDCKEYKELAEETDNVDLKNMLMVMAKDEHNHYEMLKAFIARMIK